MEALTVTAQREREWRERKVLNCSVARIQSLCYVAGAIFVYFLLCFMSNSFIFPTTRLGPESQFSDFLDGLGPAQIVGRQTLATPPMGESQAQNVFPII